MIKKILSLVLFLSLCLSVSAEAGKVAVVDVQKVVNKSSQVQALKKEQETKRKELLEFIKKAKADINKQTDPNKKKTLAANYEKQIQQKREANAKEYTTKLKAADNNITAIISKKATEMGYTMVVPKSSVICGGDDITGTILQIIK